MPKWLPRHGMNVSHERVGTVFGSVASVWIVSPLLWPPPPTAVRKKPFVVFRPHPINLSPYSSRTLVGVNELPAGDGSGVRMDRVRDSPACVDRGDEVAVDGLKGVEL